MRWLSSLMGTLVGMAILALLARFLGLEDLIREAVASGRLLDWVMGALCLLWLMVILKAPWDLYFQASAVAFEQERSRERAIALVPGRAEYIRILRKRLGLLAVGAHVGSAVLIAAISFLTGERQVGYWFAVFYLVSTVFRPAVAGYAYLSQKLSAVGEEVRYPREDIAEMHMRLSTAEDIAQLLRTETEELRTRLEAETTARTEEARELRERQNALAREFEVTTSRLTDNREVISGIQAFVRLIAGSARSAES
jgi:regulator of replication initiation timing/multisubunit Na+/H+ antiporter MnhE subunit